jgi:hypothetical protein
MNKTIPNPNDEEGFGVVKHTEAIVDDFSSPVGVVYLLCFDEPYHHARHYVGFCTSYEGVESRLHYHECGKGSRLLAAVSKAGIKWSLVRLWKGTRKDERKLHKRGNAIQYCPRCQQTPARRFALEEIAL